MFYVTRRTFTKEVIKMNPYPNSYPFGTIYNVKSNLLDYSGVKNRGVTVGMECLCCFNYPVHLPIIKLIYHVINKLSIIFVFLTIYGKDDEK